MSTFDDGTLTQAGRQAPAAPDGRVLRMLDANANRAREALRTLEDIARFGLNDAALSERLKVLRHEVVTAVRESGASALDLLAARDLAGDVGAAITTPSEGRRETLDAVAAAAAARLSESLRVIEECLKLLQEPGSAPSRVTPAARVERARYEGYAVERAVRGGLLRPACPQWRLCVLITQAACREGDWRRVARAAIAGGADCLQLREKSLPDGALLERARELVAIARSGPGRAHVIINDRADIAALAQADGVHLGQDDLRVADARAMLSPRAWVGVSTHTLEELERACGEGADYVGVGTIFSSTTKAREASGVELVREALDRLGHGLGANARVGTGAGPPLLAIGGITPENIGALVSVGCPGVAVSAVVCGAGDPEGVCRALRSALSGPSAG